MVLPVLLSGAPLGGLNLITADWVNSADDIDDNFDDNDITNWTVDGGVAASSGRMEVTISGGGSDSAILSPNDGTESWAGYRFLLVSGATWSGGNDMQGGGISKGGTSRVFLGLNSNLPTSIEWQTRYRDDSGENANDTGTMTEDVYHNVLMHFKAASGVGQNNGAAEIWAAGIKILDQTTVDSDTLTADGVKLGNNFSSGGVTAMSLQIEDAKFHEGNIPVHVYIWRVALSTAPANVYFDGSKGTEKTAAGLMTTAEHWYHDGTNLYTYSTTDPDSAYSIVEWE